MLLYQVRATMKRPSFVLATVAGLLAPGAASADLIGVSKLGPAFGPSREVTAAEASLGAPLNGDVYQFVVTTDADVLSINRVRVWDQLTGQPLNALHQHPLGHRWLDLLVPPPPTITADSFIETPGFGGRLG